MFMRVNSRCANQVRPPLGARQRRSGRCQALVDYSLLEPSEKDLGFFTNVIASIDRSGRT